VPEPVEPSAKRRADAEKKRGAATARALLIIDVRSIFSGVLEELGRSRGDCVSLYDLHVLRWSDGFRSLGAWTSTSSSLDWSCDIALPTSKLLIMA
jgi:hypothetical protein